MRLNWWVAEIFFSGRTNAAASQPRQIPFADHFATARHPVRQNRRDHRVESFDDLDDDFWLEQANKLIVESLPAVRAAAASLMTGLEALQGIYLGMLGFAKFIPDNAELWMKM